MKFAAESAPRSLVGKFGFANVYRNAIVNTSIYDVVVVQSLLLMDVHYRAGIANIPMSELRILRVHVLVSVHAHQFMFFVL